jgi:hypothetical protein
MSECSLNVIDRTLAKVNVFDKQRIADLDMGVTGVPPVSTPVKGVGSH